MPSAQASRFSAPSPHGFDWVSMPLKTRVSSAGKRASSCTRWRRMSTILSTYSIMTGHASSQARQVLQLHSTSSWMTLSSPTTFLPTSGRSVASEPASALGAAARLAISSSWVS